MAASPRDLTRRGFVAGALLTTGLVANRIVQAPAGVGASHFDLHANLPKAFAGWTASPVQQAVLPDPEEVKAVTSAYEEVVSRAYDHPGARQMMLVVAHGRPGSGLLALHRPQTCYTSQGFTVQDCGEANLPQPFSGVRTTRLLATRDARTEPVVFWASVAGQQSDTDVEQKLRLLRAAWQGRPLDAFLIRASCVGTNDRATFDAIGSFLSDLLGACSPTTKALFAA